MAPTLREEYDFKVILLGDSAVGKTALIKRYTEKKYRLTTASITISFSSHTLELAPGVSVNLNIWDTCGSERYRALTRNYYRNVAGCLLVFDLTSKVSFNNLNYWYEDISKVQAPGEVVFVLVGQKSDDVENRQVTQEEAEQRARELGMPFVETSALTGHNVEEVFEDLARRMKEEGIRINIELNEHIALLAQATTKKKCCA